jgi:hypothetical protein
MYPEYMSESLQKVINTRQKRFEVTKSGKTVFPPMSAEEREEVLNKFHPDYKPDARKEIASRLAYLIWTIQITRRIFSSSEAEERGALPPLRPCRRAPARSYPQNSGLETPIP